MRVLVTGASGLIGRHVVEALRDRRHVVRALVRPASSAARKLDVDLARADLRAPEGLAGALQGVDAVVHLAASVAGDPAEQFATTVVGTENLLAAMADAGVRRLVLASSMTVYAWRRVGAVLSEDSPLEDDPEPRGEYTVTKLWQERLARRAAEAGAVDLTVLRPGAVWGPGAEWRAEAGVTLGRVHIVVTGGPRLPLTYVENCADCFATAVDSDAAPGETFNVVDSPGVNPRRFVRASGARVLVPVPFGAGLAAARLARATARRLFGPEAQLPSLLAPERFVARFKPVQVSTRKLEEVLGWTPPVSFEEALARTFDRPHQS